MEHNLSNALRSTIEEMAGLLTEKEVPPSLWDRHAMAVLKSANEIELLTWKFARSQEKEASIMRMAGAEGMVDIRDLFSQEVREKNVLLLTLKKLYEAVSESGDVDVNLLQEVEATLAQFSKHRSMDKEGG